MSNANSINPFENFAAPAPASAPVPASSGIQWGSSVTSTGAWGPTRGPNYDVDTTYVPPSASDVVPSAWGQQPQGAWHNTPSASGPSPSTFLLPSSTTASDTVPAIPSTTAQLAFTDSTAAPVAKGTLGSAPPLRDNGAFGFPSASTPSTDTRPLLPPNPPSADPFAEDSSKYTFYNIRKYRPFFNVDTQEVLWRVTSSIIGAFKPDFMQITHTQPDLYGPFWIATTLIFVTAASGNFSSYIAWQERRNSSPPASSSGSSPASSDQAVGQWFADSTKLGTSAALFYGYAFVVSLALWFWVRYLKADVRLVNMFCVYGYALTIFIPISIICVVPVEVVRWVFVSAATLLSGGFLLMNIRDTVTELPASMTVWLLGAVALMHAGLGVALKLFFFNY